MLAAGKLVGLNPLTKSRATLCVSCQQLHQEESFVSEAAYHVIPFRAWHRYVSSWDFFSCPEKDVVLDYKDSSELAFQLLFPTGYSVLKTRCYQCRRSKGLV